MSGLTKFFDSPDDLELSLVLQPLQSERLEAYEVSPLVNSPDNDSPECVRRVHRTQERARQVPLEDRRRN
jgi:putative SOS response-associated peptidase YedK